MSCSHMQSRPLSVGSWNCCELFYTATTFQSLRKLQLVIHLAADVIVVRSEELLMSSTGLSFAGGSYLETVYV